LPMRLCCLEYGAGLVYSGVTIDHSILECVRVQNKEFGCMDYVNRQEGKVVFSTCEEERQQLIFQVGTKDACLATKAALHVCGDVRGVDVNMGCTAPFSSTGGTGAALLEKPHVVADILKSLRRELPSWCAVSCKIRMLPTVAQTIDFLRLCEHSGADAIALHMRTTDDNRDKGHPARWDDLGLLCSEVNVPILANGDLLTRRHIDDFWQRCDAVAGGEGGGGSGPSCPRRRPAAVMVARGALWNPSVFAKAEVPYDEVVRKFISTCARVNNVHFATKWTLKEMLGSDSQKPAWLPVFGGLQGAALRRLKMELDRAQNMAELCRLFGVDHDASAYPPDAFNLDYGRRLLQSCGMATDESPVTVDGSSGLTAVVAA